MGAAVIRILDARFATHDLSGARTTVCQCLAPEFQLTASHPLGDCPDDQAQALEMNPITGNDARSVRDAKYHVLHGGLDAAAQGADRRDVEQANIFPARHGSPVADFLSRGGGDGLKDANRPVIAG